MLKIIIVSLGLLFTGCNYSLNNNVEVNNTTKDTKDISQINIYISNDLTLPNEYIVELKKILTIDEKNTDFDQNINKNKNYQVKNISNVELNKIIKDIENLNNKHKLMTDLSYREVNTIQENKYSYFIDNYITDINISTK